MMPGIIPGIMPGRSRELKADSEGDGGNGSGGSGSAVCAGGLGPSRLPIMPPTPGMADATFEMSDVSGPNP